MALQEFEEQYYRLNPEKCYLGDNKDLHINFIVYKNQVEREKEKQALKLYEDTINLLNNKISLLEPIIERQIQEMQTTGVEKQTEELQQLQDLSDVSSLLLETLYKKTNEHQQLILNIIDKYEELEPIRQFVENPIEIVYTGEIVEYNYKKEKPTLEDVYNILKTRIGENIDV